MAEFAGLSHGLAPSAITVHAAITLPERSLFCKVELQRISQQARPGQGIYKLCREKYTVSRMDPDLMIHAAVQRVRTIDGGCR